MKDVLKLLKKIGILLAVCYAFVFLYIELFPQKIYTNRYAICLPQHDVVYKLKNVAPSRTLILGDSRTMSAVVCSQIPSTRNLSLAGSSPIEMFFYLKNYLQNYPKPAQVFMSFAPFHLCQQDVFWKYTVRFKLLTYNDLQAVFATAKKLNDSQTLRTSHPEIMYYKYFFKYPEYYQTELKASLFESRTALNALTYDSVFAAKGHYVFSKKAFSDHLNEEAETAEFLPSPLFAYYFEQIILLCKTNNIPFYYQTTPMNQASFGRLNPLYKAGYQSFIQKIAIAYPNCAISDSLYAYPNSCFGDASHTNQVGAERFTAQLKGFLNRRSAF